MGGECVLFQLLFILGLLLLLFELCLHGILFLLPLLAIRIVDDRSGHVCHGIFVLDVIISSLLVLLLVQLVMELSFSFRYL